MAVVAARVPAVADGLRLLPALGRRRHLGAHGWGAAARPAGGAGAAGGTKRGGPGQPDGQDHGKRGPRGYDAGKKTTGRKRHVLVDTEGLLTELVVHPADVSESAGAKRVLGKAQAAGRALAQIWVDGGYQAGVVAWAETELGYPLEVVARPPGTKGFAVLPRRWVVERSFAWIGRYRRLSKDYEALTTTSEAMIWAAVGTTMLRRLTTRGAS
jgi:transposase